jgi:diguanylate cyclase (GGDEF)-like protein/PAS domain S-box-containing protein
LITDAQAKIVYVNPVFEEVTGYTREEALGQDPGFLKSGFQDEAFYAQVWRNLVSGLPFTDIFINRRKDGELYYEAKTITPVFGHDGELTHYVSTGKDITERLKRRERLHRLVHYDPVTGLPNRVLLQERLGQSILQAERRHSAFGVMCVGLGLSELLGDMQQKRMEQLLRQVGQRLSESLETDTTVARPGEDEFVILVKEVAGRDEIEALAKTLVLAFAEPVSADGYELYLTPSVGITLYPDDGNDSRTLLEHAELAMRHARERGQGTYLFYQGAMQSRQKPLSS